MELEGIHNIAFIQMIKLFQGWCMIISCNDLECISPQTIQKCNYQILKLFPPKTLEGNLWSFILISKSLGDYNETKPFEITRYNQ